MLVYYPVCFCNGKPMKRNEDNHSLWYCSECGAKRDSDPDKAGAWRVIKIIDRKAASCLGT